MKILGVSCFYHDSAAALVSPGKLYAAGEEERWSRKKHDSSFPSQAIQFCLESTSTRIEDLEAIVFYEKPWIKFERVLWSFLSQAPKGFSKFTRNAQSIIWKTLFLRQTLLKEIHKLAPGFDPLKLKFSSHHYSHAAASYFCSPFEDCEGLIVDGVGEWATTSTYRGKGRSLTMLNELHFPHSLGLFYSAATAFCGFKVNSGEYKLMGLAPYGQPRFVNRIFERILFLRPNGLFEINPQAIDLFSEEGLFTSLWEEVFGLQPKRNSSAPLSAYHDFAASIQKALEETLLHVIRNEFPIPQSKNLCLGGGVALNCVANSRLLRDLSYEKIWIQPAAGDSGGALGAALAYLEDARPGNEERTFYSMEGSFLGPCYEAEEIEATLQLYGLVFEKLPPEKTAHFIAEDLSKELFVALFQGRMEFGPRALGARSILADPRGKEVQKKINERVKLREAFRPFAPAILWEELENWYDWKEASSYMLFTAQLKRETTFSLPAVTHVDGSARLQTVLKLENPMFHEVLTRFFEKTGCPILLNTSFNVRGEPLVCSPKDALRCFFEANLDALYLQNFRVTRAQNLTCPVALGNRAFLEDG